MDSPRVYAIYWDAYFQQHPDAAIRMDRFFGEILRGKFVRRLAQYGVGPGRLLGSKVLVPDTPLPKDLSNEAIEAQLRAWINNNTVPAPDPDETNLLYVIFTPNNTNIGNCVCGYHRSGRIGTSAGDDDLFWAAIQEWHHDDMLPRNEQEFVDSCSWCVSQEMVEAFTNRDGRGYHTESGCEIGDICETAKGSQTQKTPIIKVQMDGGWWVEPYWDNVNRSCYPLHIVPRDEAPVEGYEIES